MSLSYRRPRDGVLGLLALVVLLLVALAARPARADRPPEMSSRTIALPSGPSAMKGLGESFSPNLSTGAGNFAIPLELPPGVAKPSLSLQYTHGRGRSELGASFHLPLLQIYRTKDKGAPSFLESDRFAVSGPDFNDELVLVNDDKHYYRLKNEGSFALFVRDPAADAWTIRYANGDTALLGGDETARQYSVRGAYKWFIRTHTDVSGQKVQYEYWTDKGYVYLQAIRYQLHAPDYENRVDFVYQTRTDPFTDYGYGSPVTCRQRLTRIAVSSGCGAGCARRVVSTYLLEYDQTTQSYLRSVQLVGEGGAPGDAMPPLKFTYALPSRLLGRTVAMPQSLPLDLVDTGRARFDDVNGDGLPDLLVGVARGYTYYENLTGAAWSAPIALARSPDVSLDDASNGVVLADVNGDGFRDVLRSSPGGYSYFPGGNIVNGRFLAYLPAVPLSSTTGTLLWNDPGNRLADLNFDGRTDVLRAAGPRAMKDLNVRNASGVEGVQESDDGALPPDVARLFGDPSMQMLDFNGDGTQDFVVNEISWGDSRLRVFYGLGGARFANAKVIPAPKGNPADFLFGDTNNDGYVDLVKYSGQEITIWLAAGDDHFLGAYGPNSAWAAPARSDVRSVQLMDMDGSGTADLVLLTKTNRVVYVSFASNPFVGLLTRVDNGMGLVTTIGYRSSTDYAVDAKEAGTPWRTTLPRAIPVVSDLTVTDSLDKLGMPPSVKHTAYAYRDGFYDGKEREFRGFGYVRTTEDGDDHAESRVTETWMHLGIDQDGADQEILKGKAYRQIVANGDGAIYSSEETRWEPRWLCAEDGAAFTGILPTCALYPQKADAKDHLVAFAVKSSVLKGAWETTTTPRYSLDTFDTDAWGHATRKRSWGEVAFSAPRTIGDPVDVGALDLFVGDDETVETGQFIYDTDRWLLGLVARTETRDARTDAIVAATETQYDGDPFVGLPTGQATRGKVTRQRALLAQENRWIDTSRYARDGFDLVTDSLDAMGNHSRLTYDPETHTFVVRESVDVDGGATVFQAQYDIARGSVIASTDPSGNVSHYTYDGLGRLRTVVDPSSSVDLPSSTFDYTYGTSDSPVSLVVERHLADRATGKYHTAWRYLDATGRTRLSKTPNDAGTGYIASGWVAASASGAEAFRYQPFAAPTLGLEQPPATTPFAETFYDALRRAVRLYPAAAGPARTYARMQYLPFEQRAFDEEDTSEGTWGYPAITRRDGLGRTRQIVKYNDYRASSGTDRQRQELVWSFRYDPRGKITGFTDPAGHLREYAYDSLARMVDLRDPNTGALHFTYDDAGNLGSRVDALGQTKHQTYGAGNRLLRVDVTKDAHGKPDYAYVYHYDAPAPAGPLPEAKNVAGRVSWIEWPTGAAYLSYDPLGHVVTETDALWDPARSTFDAQARDVYRRDYELNAIGAVVRARLPGGHAFVSSYGARGKLQTLGAEADGQLRPLVTGVDYDVEGHALRTAAANGTVGCSWYNGRSELAAVASATGATCAADPTQPIAGAFQQLVYERSAARLITRITDLSAGSGLPRLDGEYTYDRLHELTYARTARGTDAYDYDAIQNLVRHTSTVPGTTAALGDLRYGENGAGPNALTTAGTTSLAYDALGNLTAYKGYALEFDAEGRLAIARKSGGPTLRHFYDAQGERRITVVEEPGAAPKVHRFVFSDYEIRDGEEVWSAGAGRVRTEIRKQPGAAETREYTYSDHLTGTTHVADETGTLIGFQQYGPYGDLQARIGAEPPLFGYAGARNEPDEDLGLVRFGARYYAPALGRWTSADPAIGESPEAALKHPLEANLYAYVGNDPMNHVDPTGFEKAAPADASAPAGAPDASAAPPEVSGGAPSEDKPRVFFAFYHNVSDGMFKRAAETWKAQITAQYGHRDSDVFIMVETKKKGDFIGGWNEIDAKTRAVGGRVMAGVVLGHASLQGDGKDGLEFRDGTLLRSEIAALPKLPWDEVSGSLTLHGCNTGIVRSSPGSTPWSPALEFAKKQGINVTGQAGYAYFSSDKKSLVTPSPGSNVYLWAFDHGKNRSWIDHGLDKFRTPTESALSGIETGRWKPDSK